MHYYCTYFDSKYLTKGLALIESLQKNDTKFLLFIVCLDKETLYILEKLNLTNVRPICIELIERKFSQLSVAKKNRTLVEYYWTLTPFIIDYFLCALEHDDIIVYIDSDIYFFSSTQPLYSEMDDSSVLIHGHNFSEENKYLEKYGRYNVGMLAFRKNIEGEKVLQWWRDRCLEYCGAEVKIDPDGMLRFGDQKYLDYFNVISECVRVSNNLGIGVAPWNQTGFQIDISNGVPLINNIPVMFYHYHSFRHIAPGCAVPAKNAYNYSFSSLRIFSVPYLETLERVGKRVQALCPDFQWMFTSESLQKDTCILLKKSLASAFEKEDIGPLFPVSSDYMILPTPSLRGYEQLVGTVKDETLEAALKRLERWPDKPRLLNCGCGTHLHSSWLNVDIVPARSGVIAMDLREEWPIPDNFFDVVYHSHVLEHMSRNEGIKFLKQCFRILKPGGILRVAIPDLESIAREYIYQLEAARTGDLEAVARYHWIILEFIDQLTRHHPGGEMLEFLRQRPLPAKEFVLQRIGKEGENIIARLSKHPADVQQPSLDALSVGEFRLGGEAHRWMYDAFSLQEALEEGGFQSIRRVTATESAYSHFASFHLDADDTGKVRKPDSLFMEARKSNASLKFPRCHEVLPAGWSGDYPDWQSASAAGGGYDSPVIFQKHLAAALAVRDGKALWERDSFLFYHEEYRQPILDWLLQCGKKNDGILNVLDFGGAFGSTYMQHRVPLQALKEISWNIVEQKEFVEYGKKEFSSKNISFFYNIDDVFANVRVNLVLFSSVLQYIETPYDYLEKAIKYGAQYVIIDRIGLIEGRDRITIQVVPPNIYSAAYPCWWLDKRRIEKIFAQHGYKCSPWIVDTIDPEGFWCLCARKYDV